MDEWGEQGTDGKVERHFGACFVGVMATLEGFEGEFGKALLSLQRSLGQGRMGESGEHSGEEERREEEEGEEVQERISRSTLMSPMSAFQSP